MLPSERGRGTKGFVEPEHSRSLGLTTPINKSPRRKLSLDRREFVGTTVLAAGAVMVSGELDVAAQLLPAANARSCEKTFELPVSVGSMVARAARKMGPLIGPFACYRLTVFARPVPEGRNVCRNGATETISPAGAKCAEAPEQPRGKPNISPRWGWGLRLALSYKHCVPLGLTLATHPSRQTVASERAKLLFPVCMKQSSPITNWNEAQMTFLKTSGLP